MAAAVFASVLLVACGGGGGSKSTTTTSGPPTTIPKPVANIEIRPASGPVGTTFMLIGTGFKPGETVTFQVIFPDPSHAPFNGPPHKTTPDGAVQTQYRTAGNPNGTYTVKATGDMGTEGQNTFVIGAGGAGGSTATTTRSSATTARSSTATSTRSATSTTR